MQDELLSKDELLTSEECGLAIQGMASGKTPGSDGFPVEFYTAFFAYVHGRLSISQCRGLIILLFKKGDASKPKIGGQLVC